MDYVCVDPECLMNQSNTSVDCYRCLQLKHQHNLPNFDHIVKLPLILHQSQENLVLVNSKL